MVGGGADEILQISFFFRTPTIFLQKNSHPYKDIQKVFVPLQTTNKATANTSCEITRNYELSGVSPVQFFENINLFS